MSKTCLAHNVRSGVSPAWAHDTAVMEMEPSTNLMSLRGPGGALDVIVRRRKYTTPGDERWYDAEIAVGAQPFVGTLHTTFTLSDLGAWERSLVALEGIRGRRP